jgi:subtilisin family serine protease
MATPHVSAAAGVMWAQYPRCPNSEIRAALQQTARRIGTQSVSSSSTSSGSESASGSAPAQPYWRRWQRQGVGWGGALTRRAAAPQVRSIYTGFGMIQAATALRLLSSRPCAAVLPGAEGSPPPA